MTYSEILKEAKDCIGPFCKACPVCNGLACGNTLPGPGCKFPGNTAARNYNKWQEILVNMDTLVESAPIDTSFEVFGKTFKMPVFIAPLGGLKLHYGEKHTDQSYNSILILDRDIKCFFIKRRKIHRTKKRAVVSDIFRLRNIPDVYAVFIYVNNIEVFKIIKNDHISMVSAADSTDPFQPVYPCSIDSFNYQKQYRYNKSCLLH